MWPARRISQEPGHMHGRMQDQIGEKDPRAGVRVHSSKEDDAVKLGACMDFQLFNNNDAQHLELPRSSSMSRFINPAFAGRFVRQVASRSHRVVSASRVLKPWAKRRWQTVSSCLRLGVAKGRKACSITLSAGRHKVEGRRTRQVLLQACRKEDKEEAEEDAIICKARDRRTVENAQSVGEESLPESSDTGRQQIKEGEKVASQIARPLASFFWGERRSTKRFSLSMDSPLVAHRVVAYAKEKRRRLGTVEAKASTAAAFD